MRNNASIQRAAQEALDLQNGVNLSGIVATLNRILTEAIWPAARENSQGTQWVNRHPIVTVILCKLGTLNAHCENGDELLQAFREVESLAADPK
jgi:hypothetical protein